MNSHSFENDHHRPRYHFEPPGNWMNDPNGLAHYNGLYHLFYQHNPFGALWGNMHWGPAVSTDLVQWRHLPIALAPDTNGPDRDGCFSGAMVVHDGEPTIVYTGVRGLEERPCLAFSEDDYLRTWKKHPGNPVLSGTSDGVRTTIFRDHTLWREGNDWLMGIGSGIEGKGGAVLLYRSRDLKEWEYQHPLVTEMPEHNESGEIVSTGWECPDFYFLEDQPVLVACDWDGHPISVSYWTGTYDDRRFSPSFRGTVDAGSCFYAPQSFQDEVGQRIMFGWLRERRSDDALIKAGWAGAMSLPRVVTMLDDGSLAFAPAPEVESLRGTQISAPLGIGELAFGDVPGNACEIMISTRAPIEDAIEIEVLRSPDGEEKTVVRIDPREGTFSVDTTSSSVDPRAFREVCSQRMPFDGMTALEARIFVDGSIVEVYINGRMCLSARAYPQSADATGVRVTNAGGSSGTIDVWEMTRGAP